MKRSVARGCAVVLAAVAATATFVALAADAPPQAPSQPVTDTIFGVAVADPYRNLEDLKNPQTQAWLAAQGAYTANLLGRIEGRDALAERIATLGRDAGDDVRNVVRMAGARVFFLRRRAGESQLKLVLREGRAGGERVLVDPEVLSRATGVPHAVNYFAPSWDGRSLAYGLSAGGSEDASLHVIDIASGKALIGPIPRVREHAVHWSPDSRSLAYNQVRELPVGTPDTETFLDSTVFVIEPRAARPLQRPLFGPLVNPELGLDRLDVGEVLFAPDSRYMIARTTDTTLPEGRLYVAPVARLRGGAIAWTQIASRSDEITQVELRGDTLYLRTHAGAPRGRILALPLKTPTLAMATEVVAEPGRGTIDGFVLGRDALYVEVREGFTVRTRRVDARGPRQGVDAAPSLPGTTRPVTDLAHAHRDAWLTHVTWTDPARLLAVGRGGVRDTGLLTGVRPAGLPELEVAEVLVASHDGARVPLAILHRKGLARTGDHPTLLRGYGAYGLSFGAGFDPRNAAWLEQGGVIALANVRGSGAFGDAWYKAGFKATKANTWKDGIACARYLIEQRYASAKTLAIAGGSAGGIFAGRAITTAPELFAAAIIDVGVTDAVRAEESANGITNVSEFGSAKVAAEFPALLEMSTYHQIRPGTAYPAVLFIHGLNDPRVDVWHSAKAAARLQASTSSGKPVLIRLDRQAGHGVGSTNEQRTSKQADIESFLLWQFGKAALKD